MMNDEPLRRIFLRDMCLMLHIGAFEEERASRQRVFISVDLDVVDDGEAARAAGNEDLAGVVNYAPLVAAIEAIQGGPHILLVETLAESIARCALDLDQRVRIVRVRVEKPDVFEYVGAVGVEIERRRLVHRNG